MYVEIKIESTAGWNLALEVLYGMFFNEFFSNKWFSWKKKQFQKKKTFFLGSVSKCTNNLIKQTFNLSQRKCIHIYTKTCTYINMSKPNYKLYDSTGKQSAYDTKKNYELWMYITGKVKAYTWFRGRWPV